MRRGLSDGDIAKLAGGNVLRALGAAEAVAQKMKTSSLPILTIEDLDSQTVTA
jgi:membrane dipeptidase